MTQAHVPGLVADYFGPDVVRADHPIIAEAFVPGVGWKRPGFRKRVSVSWLRKIAREGVTSVALDCAGRRADFTIAEVVRHAERPLFGGRII